MTPAEQARPLRNDLSQASNIRSIEDLDLTQRDRNQQTYEELAVEPNGPIHQELKFFDDETVSGRQPDEYKKWQGAYLAVYKKFITPQVGEKFQRVKIAVLDTGIDLTHPSILACNENIKGKYDFLADSSKGVGDSEGHGTFVTILLHQYAPDAHIYVGKVATGNGPSGPEVIAKVRVL